MDLSHRSMAVEASRATGDACALFLDELNAWAQACVDRHGDQPATDCHDQLTYTTGWEPLILSSQDATLTHFQLSEQEKVASHFEAQGAWRHGYWRMQEAHHGTEHFELFLGSMTRTVPGNPTTRRQLLDAVEHIGNWSSEVPDWYDATTGLFRSLHFGADGVRPDPHQLNMPDHLRCANLLLLAYDVSRDVKYLTLAESYAERWASAIGDDSRPLPIGLTRDGVLFELAGAGEEVYRSFAGMAGALDTDLDRAENILASGGVQLFLRLWRERHNDVLLQAVTRLLTVLSGALSDADAGPVADAIRCFRRVTGRRDFDAPVTQAVASLDPYGFSRIGIALPPPLKRRPAGVGKRSDMPAWYEDDAPRRHNPILLATAAEILDDPVLACRAVDLARTYFSLAVQLLPDGREHGCAARTVSAIARGHGRNNHAGMSTAVLWPTMQKGWM